MSNNVKHAPAMTASPQDNQDPFYVGEFRHNLDPKNRITVPAKWRFSGDDVDGYVAWVHPEGYIAVYPPRKIKEFRERIVSIAESDKRGQRILWRLFGKADRFGCDTQGRIKLSDKMVKDAGIRKAVMLVGLGETFNIWSAERFARQDEEDFDLLEAMSDFGI